MTFKEKLEAAGFKTKREYADLIGYSYTAVSKWGDSPPRWVLVHLNDRIRYINLMRAHALLLQSVDYTGHTH